VKPGPSEAENTAIESGLQAGERVVTDGVDRLREGARVQIPEKGAAPGPASDDAAKKGGRRKRQEGG
jgi:multidrug efflux system membrane fusion protein